HVLASTSRTLPLASPVAIQRPSDERSKVTTRSVLKGNTGLGGPLGGECHSPPSEMAMTISFDGWRTRAPTTGERNLAISVGEPLGRHRSTRHQNRTSQASRCR